MKKRLFRILNLVSSVSLSISWLNVCFADPNPTFSNFQLALRSQTALRVLGFADSSHYSVKPVQALETALPDLLNWGMTSLVIESTAFADSCLNEFLISDPSVDQRPLEDFCPPVQYAGSFGDQFLVGLRYPNSLLRTFRPEYHWAERSEIWRRIFLSIREWNRGRTHKVKIHPTDFSLTHVLEFMSNHVLDLPLRHIRPNRRLGQQDLGGENLGSMLGRVIGFFNQSRQSRLRDPDRSRFTPYIEDFLVPLRIIEDHDNIDRLRFYSDTNEKLVIFYGLHHIGHQEWPGSLDGRPLHFLVDLLSDRLGNDQVKALLPVISPRDGAVPGYTIRIEGAYRNSVTNVLQRSSPGIYTPAVLGELSYAELTTPFGGMSVDYWTVSSRWSSSLLRYYRSLPNKFDFFWVNQNFSP